MPNTSIHLPDEMIQKIDERKDDDASRSKWIRSAIERELDHEHDDIDAIEQRLVDIEEWKDEVMKEMVQWFNSEYGPAE